MYDENEDLGASSSVRDARRLEIEIDDDGTRLSLSRARLLDDVARRWNDIDASSSLSARDASSSSRMRVIVESVRRERRDVRTHERGDERGGV